MPILADYFIVVSIPPEEKNIGVDGVEPVVVCRYPPEDHKKHRFPENAPFFCFPESAKIAHYKAEDRKPFFFTFCFTVEDGSRSYGTTLFYLEPLKVGGDRRTDAKGNCLYVPKALCILSHQPMFSVFAVFLRELFRNAIACSDDQVDEDPSVRIRKTSFNSKLRKGSVYAVIDEDSIVDLPIERHIRYFIDYCPSLEPTLDMDLVVFQKVVNIRMPPTTALPFTDKLCFEALLSTLSMQNILQVVAFLLQEQRVLLVSSQVDILTLCAESFISLLYPFKWMHPFVPILPSQLIEYLEAPTPYLMGVTRNVFDSSECQQALDGVVIVTLDQNKVEVPDAFEAVSLPKTFKKKLEKFVLGHSPPPATRILYCDSSQISQCDYMVFEVTFGPGKLGIKMNSCKRSVCEDEEEQDCVYIVNSKDDIAIQGPGKKVELFQREPIILAVNGTPVVGLRLKEVTKKILEASQPLQLRLQIGISPKDNQRYLTRTRSSVSEILSPSSSEHQLGSISEEFDREEEEKGPVKLSKRHSLPKSPILDLNTDEIALDDGIPDLDFPSDFLSPPAMVRQPTNPRLMTPVPEDDEVRIIRRYYEEVQGLGSMSKESKHARESRERAEFVETIRAYFLLEMCDLFLNYREFLVEEENAEEIFKTKKFLKSISEENQPIIKNIVITQLFNHFIHDAHDFDDNYEVNLFNEAISVLKELGDYAVEYIMSFLLPDKWRTTTVEIPAPDSKGLAFGWEGLVFTRDPEFFPELNKELFGDSVKRLKMKYSDVPRTIIPQDWKSVKKSMKLLKTDSKKTMRTES